MPLAINENLISNSSHCQWQWSPWGWLAGLAVTLSSSELHSNLLLINTSLCFTPMMYSKAHTALTDNTLDVQWPDIFQMDSISTGLNLSTQFLSFWLFASLTCDKSKPRRVLYFSTSPSWVTLSHHTKIYPTIPNPANLTILYQPRCTWATWDDN